MHKVVWGEVCCEVVRGPVLVCVLEIAFGMHKTWRVVSW